MGRKMLASGAVLVGVAVLLGVAGWHATAGGERSGKTAVAVTSVGASPVVRAADTALPSLPPGAIYRERVLTNEELEVRGFLARWGREFQDAVDGRIAWLLERGDAQSLYEAYLLLPASDALGSEATRDRQAILDRARTLAPDDLQLALMAAIECGGTDCDGANAIREVLRLQPDNAVGALLALEAALESGDRAAIDQWLARAAAADYYRMGYARTARDYASAFENVPAPPMNPDALRRTLATLGLAPDAAATVDDLVMLQAAGVVVAHPLPSMAGLSDLCAARRVSPAHLATCQRIWGHMAGSDTVIAQAIALSQLVQMPGNATEQRHWKERLRHFHWTMHAANRVQDMQLVRDHLRLGEFQAWQRLLQRHGLTMPPGWLPNDPHYRSLILTGRLPPGTDDDP